MLGERKLRHHLDGAAAVRTRVGASFDHLPDASDDIFKRLPRPQCRYGSRSSAAAVARHSARVQGAAVGLGDLRRLAVETTQRVAPGSAGERLAIPPSYKEGARLGARFSRQSATSMSFIRGTDARNPSENQQIVVFRTPPGPNGVQGVAGSNPAVPTTVS